MNTQLQRILAGKRAERVRLAALPFAKKLAILELLRDRTLTAERSSLYLSQGAHDSRAWIVRENGATGRSE